MRKLALIKKWANKLMAAVADFLAPEDRKVKSLLALPPGVLRDLLPKSPVYSKDIFVLFDYQNKIVKLIVRSIKYKNNAGLRKRVALYLYEELAQISEEVSLFEGAPPILLPMPMSRKEKRSRGFNQTEELCRDIERWGTGNIVIGHNVLKKIKETARQTELSREKREENVKNSMSVPDYAAFKIKDRVCIVLDDVYTTGASLVEARRALLGANAKRVIGLFIAH